MNLAIKNVHRCCFRWELAAFSPDSRFFPHLKWWIHSDFAIICLLGLQTDISMSKTLSVTTWQLKFFLPRQRHRQCNWQQEASVESIRINTAPPRLSARHLEMWFSASYEIVDNSDWTLRTSLSDLRVQGYHWQESPPMTSSSIPSTLPDNPLPHLFLVQSVRNRTVTMASFSKDPTENSFSIILQILF